MAFLDELFFQDLRHKSLGIQQKRLVDNVSEPIALDDVKEFLNITSDADDANLTGIISAVRMAIENIIERAIFTQTWQQTQDGAKRIIELYRRPLLRVNSVQYIANLMNDTLVTFPSSGYFPLTGERSAIAARTVWPAHRGLQSIVSNYDLGMVDLANSADADTITAARAAVPSNLRLAMYNFCGHLIENREGDGSDNRWEHLISLNIPIGDLPKNVGILLREFMDFRQ